MESTADSTGAYVPGDPASMPDRTLFDFERGTFDGWTAAGGDAFGARPVDTETDLWPVLKPWMQNYRFTGWQGRYLAASNMWASEKHRWHRPAYVPRGRLLSDPFTITHPYLTFRLAGLAHPEVRVALMVDGVEARRHHAGNAFDLAPCGWDVRDLAGKEARLALICEADEKVLLRADDFRLTHTPPAPDAAFAPSFALDCPDIRTGRYTHVLDSAGLGTSYWATCDVAAGPDGLWWLMAEESVDRDGWYPQRTTRFVQARARTLAGPWETMAPPFDADDAQGGTGIRRPRMLVHEGMCYLFYQSIAPSHTEAWHGPAACMLATSPDGGHWTRHAPLFVHEAGMSPLAVVRVGARWAMFYALPGDAHGGRPAFVCRMSDDLMRWSAPRDVGIAQREDAHVGEGSFLSVLAHGEYWYLVSRGPVTQRGRTRLLFSEVWRSRDPFRWHIDEDYRGILNVWGGCPLVRDHDGQWYQAYCHLYARGLWLAPVRLPAAWGHDVLRSTPL